MKFDLSKLVSLIGIAMSIVEKVKGAKTGPEKEAAVVEAVQDKTDDLEEIFGLDFVDNDELNKLLKSYIAARVSLFNGIAAAKALKPKKD